MVDGIVLGYSALALAVAILLGLAWQLARASDSDGHVVRWIVRWMNRRR